MSEEIIQPPEPLYSADNTPIDPSETVHTPTERIGFGLLIGLTLGSRKMPTTSASANP